MQLLAALYSSGIGQGAQELLPEMLPRTWPLFRHSLSSVRAACVQCLAALVAAPMNPSPAGSAAEQNIPDNLPMLSSARSHWLPSHQLTTACRLLFQNVLMEADVRMRRASQDTLQHLAQQCSTADVQAAISGHLAHSMLQLAGTPSSQAWPAGSLLQIQGPWESSPAPAKPFAEYPKDATGELAADVRIAASECLASLAAAMPPGEPLSRNQ